MSKLPRQEWDNYLSWLEDYEYRLLGLPKPDAVVFLDMPPEVSQTLLSGRYHGDEQKKDIHEKDVSYLLSCRISALYAAEKRGWQVVSCVDEQGQVRSVEEIQQQLLSIMDRM